MTALRQRLIDDLHLRGYAERTVESYVAVVSRLARHFRAAPDQYFWLHDRYRQAPPLPTAD